MTKTLLSLCCLLALTAACGGDAPATTSAPKATGGAPMDDHGHGDPHPLGELTVGAHTFQVILESDVTAGGEAVLTLEFADGKPVPSTVRAWVGVESGQGSMKTRLAKEGKNALHHHVEVPKPIPEGGRIWIEIEENGAKATGSVAWH